MSFVSQKPIDLLQLARYTGGDPDLDAEVLDMFARQSELAVSRLETLLGTTDIKAWRDIAHSLKGSALYVGAVRLAEIAARAEEFDPAAAPAEAARALEAVKGEVGTVAAFIATRLKA